MGLEAFALHPLAHQFAITANGLGAFAGLTFGGFLIGAAQFHFPEYAFALQLFLEGAQRLIDIVVANDDLNDGPYSFEFPRICAIFRAFRWELLPKRRA